jgi:hypothetical protein
LEFNAHRVFAPQTVIDAFPELDIVSFSFVSDDDEFCEQVSPIALPASEMACGLFEFTKPSGGASGRGQLRNPA